MERLSNDIYALRQAARREIENFDLVAGEKVLAYFSESPAIAGFPFKIVVSEEVTGAFRSRFRQWDTEYDFNRWKNGIYNLDRLRVITDEKELTGADVESLRKSLLELGEIELPHSIQNETAIVLDGSEWKFGLCNGNVQVDYFWKAATEEIELFVPMIELMKNQHATINRRH